MKTLEEIKKGLEHCHACKPCLDQCPYGDKRDTKYSCETEMLADAITYIKQLEAQMPKWISVEERLPEEDMRVPVVYRFPRSRRLFTTMLDYYARDPHPHFQHTLGECGPIVVYWMPLPEPPKE